MKTDEELLDQAIDLYLSALKGLGSFVSQPSAEYHLSFEQYLILRTIVNHPKVKLMDIAEERHVSRSAISRQLKILLNNDYVRQSADPADRRKMFLISTDKGMRVEEKIRRLVMRRFSSWLDTFGQERGAQLLTLLADFNQQIVQPNTFDGRSSAND